MIHRKQESPTFDPKALRLPSSPKIVELRGESMSGSNGEEALRVWVVVESLTKKQRTDYGWTLPIRRAICRELDRMQDERLPVLFVRLKSDMEEDRRQK